MRLFINNQVLTLGGNSTVKNEQDELVFKVKGKFFSLFNLKVLKDINNKNLFYIRNKFWHKPFHKSTIIYDANKKKIATVSTASIIGNSYNVIGTTKPIKIDGFGWNLDIYFGEKQIGKISLPEIKKATDVLRVSDAYVLDVFEEEDASFLVAIMIAIDNIHDEKRKDLRS